MPTRVPGEGPIPCRGMVVGMNPGAVELAFGRPFVGPSGRLLMQAFAKHGIQREDLYLTNVVKIGTPNNREPDLEEVEADHAGLVAEIQKVGPRLILATGDFACRCLCGRGGISSIRGQPQILLSRFRSDAVVVPAYHPAAALRNPKYKAGLEEDVEVFARMFFEQHETYEVTWEIVQS